ncbi:hypothetical protein WICPIJ_001199 [Wickerhamomyces pijperi]|uniref:Acyl carrier protein n=1 Tax=Wickerhamomyces pijperi TaxID=599730 RepID=A0A9P8QEA8_WICPI|nr:hypothetical protein WICPIJ_001199 [Wickerhamomyces pijperi]
MFKRLLTPLTNISRRSLLSITHKRTSIASFISLRQYSHLPPLTKELISQRLIAILEGYDKINLKDKQITSETSFSKDLGLDSLDVVEVIMAIEEEFSIGIPEEQTDNIKTVNDAIQLIANDQNAV